MLTPQEVFQHLSAGWKFITYDAPDGWVAHLDKPSFNSWPSGFKRWMSKDKGRTHSLTPINITIDYMRDEKECIWERELTFEELELGEFFLYIGDSAPDTRCIKITNSNYARLECHSLYNMPFSTPVRRVNG